MLSCLILYHHKGLGTVYWAKQESDLVLGPCDGYFQLERHIKSSPVDLIVIDKCIGQ